MSEGLGHWGPRALAPGQWKTPATSVNSLSPSAFMLKSHTTWHCHCVQHMPHTHHIHHPVRSSFPAALTSERISHDRHRQPRSVCRAIIHHCINKHELVMAQLDGVVLTFTGTIMVFSSLQSPLACTGAPLHLRPLDVTTNDINVPLCVSCLYLNKHNQKSARGIHFSVFVGLWKNVLHIFSKL